MKNEEKVSDFKIDLKEAISIISSLKAKNIQLREALEEYDNWGGRMPDAEFNNTDPRWDWWHERPAKQAKSALDETK